mgnify:CR=1 FL=1|jgi:hypothetical protein
MIMSIEKEFTNSLKFRPMSTEELANILGLTIKKDEANKLITFLCLLSAYTEDSQFNISFNAPSSTGKSYIPIEVAKLFPPEDVKELGYSSPTAFFHEQGEYNKETNTNIVDLSRKIIIFLDQPNPALLERLRSLLSHDKKEMQSKITDKKEKGGNKTKTIILKGFPSVIFCSAGLMIDEQEGTRFLLLSPDTDQEKIRRAIHEKIQKEAMGSAYFSDLEDNPERKLLKERILAVKEEKIDKITISNPELIEAKFTEDKKHLKPRHQRDIGTLISFVKGFALLNLWWRKKDGNTLIANADDIENGFKLWQKISESQDLNLPPYIYGFYKDIVTPLLEEKDNTDRKEILNRHNTVYGGNLPEYTLRTRILPMLESCGLIVQGNDPEDKRRLLIFKAGEPNQESDIEDLEEDWDKDVFPTFDE